MLCLTLFWSGEQFCHIIISFFLKDLLKLVRVVAKPRNFITYECALLRVDQQWASLGFCPLVLVRSIIFMIHSLCWLWLSNIGFIHPHISRVYFVWKELGSWRCIQSKYAWFIPSGKIIACFVYQLGKETYYIFLKALQFARLMNWNLSFFCSSRQIS